MIQWKRKKPKPLKRKPHQMNDTESAFAWQLRSLVLAGEILDYQFEPMKFTLARKIEGGHREVTYTPDFMIVHKDHIEFVDIKAKGKKKTDYDENGKKHTSQWSSMRDDARVKINMAAEKFWYFEWSIYYLCDNQWVKETVSGPIEEGSANETTE